MWITCIRAIAHAKLAIDWEPKSEIVGRAAEESACIRGRSKDNAANAHAVLARAYPLKSECVPQTRVIMETKRGSFCESALSPNFAMRCNAVSRLTSSHSGSF